MMALRRTLIDHHAHARKQYSFTSIVYILIAFIVYQVCFRSLNEYSNIGEVSSWSAFKFDNFYFPGLLGYDIRAYGEATQNNMLC